MKTKLIIIIVLIVAISFVVFSQRRVTGTVAIFEPNTVNSAGEPVYVDPSGVEHQPYPGSYNVIRSFAERE